MDNTVHNIKIWEMTDNRVHFTDDYGMFHNILGNRLIMKRHVEEIKVKIVESGYFPAPIIVNELYQVIDGQHRLEALKALGLPVAYIIIKGLGVRECIIMNSTSSNWTARDFLDSYANNGYEGYVRIRNLFEDFRKKCKNLTLNNVLMATTGKSRPTDAFKYGHVTVDGDGEAYAAELLNFACDFIKELSNSGIKPKDCMTNAAIFAYQVQDLDSNRLLSAITKNVDGKLPGLRECSSISGCLSVMSEMYNKGLKRTTGSKRKIFLDNEYCAVSDVHSWYSTLWGWNDKDESDKEPKRRKSGGYVAQTMLEL